MQTGASRYTLDHPRLDLLVPFIRVPRNINYPGALMNCRKRLSLFLNELWILIFCIVITLAFLHEAQDHVLPCPLCLLQRVGMIITGIGPLLNLIFGLRVKHYALAIAGALFGGMVSIRQILLHICPQFETFGSPVLGLELYTWAFIIAVCSLIGLMILLTLYEPTPEYRAAPKMGLLGYFVCTYFLLIVVANMVTTFMECGWGFCPDNPTVDIF